MTDHFDDSFLLANAYLDGELTDDAAARAEADPEVMAEVEALRALQADVRDIDSAAAPSDATRESAIAAAMAAFATPAADAAATNADAVPGEVLGLAPDRAAADDGRGVERTVTPRRPRRRPMGAWLLGAAAAAVVALAVGSVVVQNRGSDDSFADDDADAREGTVELAAEQGAVEESAATAEIAEDSGDMTAAGEAELAADAADELDAGAALEDSAEASTADSAADGGDDALAPDTSVVVTPDDVDPATLPDPDELAAVVTALLDDRDAGLLPPSPNTACAFGDDRLGAAVLATLPFDTDVGPRDLLVGVDDFAETALAIDSDTCEIVLEVRLD